MRKSILFVAALALVFASCEKGGESYQDKTVATFEEAAISPSQAESYLAFKNDTTVFFESGIFKAQQVVSYGGGYVVGAVISNQTTTSVEDGYADAYKSAKGGAYQGRNFMVWYADSWGPASLSLTKDTVVGDMAEIKIVKVKKNYALGKAVRFYGRVETAEISGNVRSGIAQGGRPPH